MKLVRSLKFEVVFPGLRKQDRSVVYKRVWGVMDDLTRAANKLMSLTYMVKSGLVESPVRSDGKKIPFQSLPYAALKPEPDWTPGGNPVYVPYKDNWRPAGGVLSALGEIVTSRLQTDFKDLQRGSKSLATFRRLPITVRASEIKLRPDGSIELTIFARQHRNTRVVIRPRQLDASQKKLLARIQAGELKMGSGKLIWSDTRKKWLFSLAWTDENHQLLAPEVGPPSTGLLAGVHLGIVNAIWLVFAKPDGEIVKKPKVITFPRRVLRAVAGLTVERKERSACNRAEVGLRAGRGITRKLRVTDSLGDKVMRLNDTMIKQMAAAAVKECTRRGAVALVMENHTNWSVERMNQEAYDASTKAEAARIRKSYFRFHQGAMRQYLRQASEKAGLRVVEIDPAYTSRTCHQCGLVHKRDWFKNPPVDGDALLGKISREEFVCSCGYEGNAEHNAGVNIVRRGLEVMREQVQVAGATEAAVSP